MAATRPNEAGEDAGAKVSMLTRDSGSPRWTPSAQERSPDTGPGPYDTEARDADTADLFAEVSRGADKHFWVVEAHLQAAR